ncbi:uncharacterized protein BDR25DRAFT_271700 [Lindgomyces ingoldianus]|uniref:Uncharacterized protein n=1 Tax=Lindgomyces ingoldianus TaxID=673940 RepID=A0ACB6QCL7_9PLEO|nr:uncharacterized protein BDR25DRAFT_271700 [Lindgomyces ingoldianus]KAF2464656.1 hypothetical protein BDR25DRAFT_271700 [Lindgomyces ingoldianus]
MASIDILNLPDYTAQMRSFQRSDEARQKLFEDVLEKYEKLVEEHTNLKHDYSSERDVRRNYQGEVNRMHKELVEIQNSVDSNSFVLTLIDGDGVIFQDMLLLAGANGGSEAASKLQNAIREHIVQIYPNSGTWPIMVHVYLSLDKLSQTLARVGLLKYPQEMRAFAQNFSVNQPLFSIIDVGQGKERADFMIKEMLRTFSDNPTCKHIIFGGCHDNGYLLNLDQYKHNQVKAARITLLEATTPQTGFTELPNFKRTRFDSVFRSEALPSTSTQGTAPTFSPVQTQIKSTTKRPSPIASPTPASVTPAPVTASPSTTASSLATQSSGSAPASWAIVGKAGGSNGTISIAGSNKNAAKKKYIYFNKDGYRLDEALPPRDRNASEAIEKRMEKTGRNLCNHWHLNKGSCTNGNFCRFQHEPKLTPAELVALRYKTRSLACKRRDCDKFDCYLGHQCSYERDNGYCPYETCNLRASHGIDKTKHVRYDEDWNEEYSK